MINNIALICITHDPQGNNFELIKKYGGLLGRFYHDLYITVSDETDCQILSVLEENHFKIKIIPKLGAANARREVINFSLGGTNAYFHYCDFDRILTWVSRYPNELEAVVKNIPLYDYVILGRTQRAFDTHPIEWCETEKISNRITSLELGMDVDVTAGSCGFSRYSAEVINTYSSAIMTDAEWPMIVQRIGKRDVGYLAVEGLEYKEEINGERIQRNEANRWLSRLKLCYIISETAVKTGKE